MKKMSTSSFAPKTVPELLIPRPRIAATNGSRRERLSFTGTEETSQMRKNLKKINQVPSKHMYDLE